jgi:predicted PilT family ATPase
LPVPKNKTDYIKINTSTNITLISLILLSDKTYDKEHNAVGFCLFTHMKLAEMGMIWLHLSPLSHHRADDELHNIKFNVHTVHH